MASDFLGIKFSGKRFLVSWLSEIFGVVIRFRCFVIPAILIQYYDGIWALITNMAQNRKYPKR